jgi:hypothetical protein
MTTDTPEATTPVYDKDDLQWDKEAAELRHKALENVRARAVKWEATVATLLGLFSTVAIVTGPESIDKVTTWWIRWSALVLILIAGIAAGTAIFFAARAAQGPDPKLFDDLDGETLEVLTLDRVDQAVDDTKRSRRAAFLAAGLLFTTGLLVAGEAAYAAGQSPGGSSVVVVDESGNLTCGKLAADSNGATTVAGRSLSRAKQVIPVTRCGSR